jgi:ADP-L-glycero-D-manno-heptose 6-epimerase
MTPSRWYCTSCAGARTRACSTAGTGTARTWLDLGRSVFTALGRPADIRFTEMPPGLRDRYQYFTQAQTGNLRAAKFEAPFCSLEQGVAKYVRELQAEVDR